MTCAAGLACAGFACVGFGLGFGAVTLMVGSSVPAAAGASSGAGVVAGCPSSTPDGEGTGVAGAGAGLAGAEGDCGNGVGAVCANAPVQSDEINKEVDASRRERNATESPLSGAKTNNNHLCAWSPHRDCPLPTFRYLPPSTSKGGNSPLGGRTSSSQRK